MKYLDSFSSFSTDDIEKAKEFYGATLGLEATTDKEMGILTVKMTNGGQFIIYPKGADHSPANFTVLNLVVEDIATAVDELAGKGVAFEHYDSEYIKTDEKGIASGGPGPSIAWFKDPAGNILSVIAGKEGGL